MKRNHDNGRSSSLPWWTWVLPFFIANLGTGLSIWFKTDPGASLWYLPTAFGIVMVYWWGPRVLLGIYLNAVVCAPLWDLPWQWSFLYALPETIEVGLSWLFFIKLMRGKCWLPDLRNVGAFLLFGSLLPTFLANTYLVLQLYLLGDIAGNTIWDNWRILISADLATQFVFSVPILVVFTKLVREKGWTETKDDVLRLVFLPNGRDLSLDKTFLITAFGITLITVSLFPVRDLGVLYGFLMIFIAIRYGVYMAVISSSWIGLLAFLLPIVLKGDLGLSTAAYGDFIATNFDILFLCGVTLLTGRAISDLSTEVAERRHVEEELRDSEELHRVTLSNISDAVFVTDDDGTFIYVCSNVNVIFGYSHAEVTAYGNLGKLLGEDLFDAEELDRKTEIQNIERQISTKAGDRRAILVNVKRVSIRGGTVLHTCHDITERKQAHVELAKRAAQMRALASHLETVREEERTRIAREIHDEFGQFLTVLKMDLAWVSRRLEIGDEKRERLNQAASLVDENVRRVQRLATELRPGLLDDLGLMSALDWLAQEFSKRTGLLCELNLPEHELNLNSSLNTTLFRIFQEALTNIARHAQASRVQVRLQERDQTLLLRIDDNGRGITEAELNDPHSLGLLGLHERVAQWKGDLSIRGEAGKGTTVIVQIPIPPFENGGAT